MRFLPLHRRALLRVGPALAVLAFAGAAQAQQFQLQPGLIPGPAVWTEGLECADVENDGDLDIFFANGDGFASAGAKRQNGLIINNFPIFTDQSVARLGVSVSNAKMVITGDIQNDGFIDALFCNAFNNDLPFLFVNQPGNPGFFDQQSVARGFTTVLSSASGQFGDLDNDGDLDLILNHAGASFLGGAGAAPRLYLNNGLGFFTENPVKMNAPNKVAQMDVQLVDIDNDFDLDFYGANRAANGGQTHYLMLNDGSASFTNASNLIPATSANVYESEMADLDGDGDLDNFFVSLSGFGEGVHRNNLIPSGTLSFTAGAPFGTHDDNEIALLDFDNDGDYDSIVGSLSGPAEKLYRNDGSLTFVQVAGAFTNIGDSTLDTAVADLNNDGAYDVITAQGESNPAQFANKVYANVGAPDTLAPVIVREETLVSPSASGPWVVRTLVRDQVIDDARNWVTGSGDYVVNTAPANAGISITGFSFVPTSVVAGTTVTWTNNSGVPHNVTSTTDGYGFASGNFGPGGSYGYTFVRPGTYTYTCTIHPGMNGVLTVTGSSSASQVTYSSGSVYRAAMTDTAGGAGIELVYETRYVDWAGNLTVSPSKRVPLPVACGFASYGVGASPVNDLILAGSGSGAVGGSATLTTSNPPVTGTFLGISLGSSFLPLFGGVVLIDPFTALTPLFVPTVAGASAVTLPIPANPALAGVSLFFQSFGLDGTKPQGLALSNGVELTICP